MPEPNQAGLNNLSAYAVGPDNFDSFIGKIDQRITEEDTLAFRITNRQSTATNPYTNAYTPGGNNTGLFGATAFTHTVLAGLTYTRLFSPTLINEFRLAFTRNNSQNRGGFSGSDYTSMFGLPVSSTNSALIGFPEIEVTGYQQLGPANNFPIIYFDNTWTPGDTFTWVRGNHLLKFGTDLLHAQVTDPYANNSRGTYIFNGFWTGQAYADFLLGYLNSDSRLLGVNTNHLLTTDYGFFVQDDWKATNHVTLNIGLRYELDKPPIESAGRWSNFIPSLNKVVVASMSSLTGTGIGFTNPSLVETAAQAGFPQALTYVNKKDFAPRFGFAWRPLGGNQTVIRGGYGIFYGGIIQNNVRNGLANVFPFVISQTGNRSATNPLQLTWTNPFPAPSLVQNIGTVALNAYELHPPAQYMQSWNFTIERQVGFSSAIELAYVGSKGTHLPMQDNINQAQDRSIANPAGFFPYPQWSGISMFQFQASSNYEGATATFKRRFVHGFFYTFNYTYSKSIDDASQFSGASTGGISGVQNPLCLPCDRGRSDWDIGHMFTASYSWESPSHNLILRGWQFAGTSRLSTGNPFTPVNTGANLTLGEASRPNRIGKGTVPNPNSSQWFYVPDFPLVPNNSFLYGNSGRNILDGPGTITVNQTIYRNFRFAERDILQFRWEVFNVLNHANFQLPVNNVAAANAGTLTSVVSPGRQMQFGLRLSF